MIEAIQIRHSVRQYLSKSVEEEKRAVLNELVKNANEEACLNIKVCYDEPAAFDTFMAHYGKFSGVCNYVVLLGEKNKEEQVGYYGEKFVLTAQKLGLNSCWVALTYGKGIVKRIKNKGEKLYCVIAFGYGKTCGIQHKSKSANEVSNLSDDTPEWFTKGVESSLLAPTAMNQQKFKFLYKNGKVKATAGKGFYTKIDLGIAKLHFEIGAGEKIEYID